MNKITSVNKAWVGGIVAALVPWLMLDVLQLDVPGEVMLAINAIVVALVVWAVPNVQKAVDKVTND